MNNVNPQNVTILAILIVYVLIIGLVVYSFVVEDRRPDPIINFPIIGDKFNGILPK